jgi:hypothetical protein
MSSDAHCSFCMPPSRDRRCAIEVCEFFIIIKALSVQFKRRDKFEKLLVITKTVLKPHEHCYVRQSL